MLNYEVSNIFKREFPERAKLASWKRYIKNKYGITADQYNELFNKQDGCCALCGKHQSELKMRLAIDHCHATAEIRSLLCQYCNLRVVGKLRKDTIQRIYDYLHKPYTGWFVPPKKKKRRKTKR